MAAILIGHDITLPGLASGAGVLGMPVDIIRGVR
jgi:hypothetical protein